MTSNLPLVRHTLREAPFTLQTGGSIPSVTLAYQTFGTRNANGTNCVLVAHALTGNTNCIEWCSGVLGDGRAIDPAKDWIICINYLGSCYGSTGPENSAFPEISIRDIARSQFALLLELGITHLRLAIGGSMGAMILLELALLNLEAGSPIAIDSLALIATSVKHSAWRIAMSSTIRTAIETCTALDAEHGLIEGLKLARQFAMISYRSNEEFDERFDRNRVNDRFTVVEYLQYQGDAIAARFSPYAYLALTRAMELHAITDGRDATAEALLARLPMPVLWAGISSDLLYPEEEIRTLASCTPHGTYRTLQAKYGHDSFLVRDTAVQERWNNIIGEWQVSCVTRAAFAEPEVAYAD